jgi:hypothetical protein
MRLSKEQGWGAAAGCYQVARFQWGKLSMLVMIVYPLPFLEGKREIRCKKNDTHTFKNIIRISPLSNNSQANWI